MTDTEARFASAILDTLDALVVVLDRDGRVIRRNRACERMTGYSSDEIAGKRFWDFLPVPEEIPSVREAFTRLLAGEFPYHQESHWRTKDGGSRLIAWSNNALLDEHGSVEYVIATGIHVTERHLAEEVLRESEERYRTLHSAMSEGVALHEVIYDQGGVAVDYRILDVNPAFERITGLSGERAVGKPASILFGGGVAPYLDVYALVAATGEPACFEAYFEPMAKFFAVSVFSPSRGRFATVFQDITERKQTTDALRDSEERYRTLVEALDDAVHVRDREGRFVMLNAATARRQGRSEEDLLGVGTTELHPPDLAIQIAEADRLVFETGQTVELVEEHPTRSFAQVCHVKKVPLRSRDGEIVGVVTLSRDVTERVRAEAALQEANEKLIVWVGELEARNRESALVNEMGDLLQTCTTLEDAYAVFAHSMPRLFPDTSGAFYVISASRNLADAVSSWGSLPETEAFFAPEECWGLRRGRAHEVEDPTSGLLCRHVRSPLEGGYLCIPMVAQGETLGSFHLRLKEGGIPDPVRSLATTVADHAGLAIANLRLRQTLRDQAIHDQLTGLYNRRYMEEMLDREISRAIRFGTPLGVIMMDVDHFKRFNDLFGHEAGDTILSALGGYLRTHIRAEDIACRYGGEELLLILPEADPDGSRRKAEELLEGISQLRVEFHHQILGPVTVSMGVAAFPAHASHGADLVRAADLALYRAKSEGRDRVMSATS